MGEEGVDRWARRWKREAWRGRLGGEKKGTWRKEVHDVLWREKDGPGEVGCVGKDGRIEQLQ